MNTTDKAKQYEGKFLETARDAWYQELLASGGTKYDAVRSWSEQAVAALFDGATIGAADDFAVGAPYKFGDHYGVVLEIDTDGIRGTEFGTRVGYAGMQEGYAVLRKFRPFDSCTPLRAIKLKTSGRAKTATAPEINRVSVASDYKASAAMPPSVIQFEPTDAPPSAKSAATNESIIEDTNGN